MARNINGTTTQWIVLGSGFDGGATPVSLAAWINPATVTASQTIIAGNTGGLSLYINSTANPAISNTGLAVIGTSTGTVSPGVWTHVAVTWNGTNFAFYINGVAAGSGSNAKTTSGATPYAIGVTTPAAPAQGWNGNLADIASWNVFLTLLEFEALAGGIRPGFVRPKSLIGWWPLDGLQSPEPDMSGNKNNGTITGASSAFGPPFAMFTPRWPQFPPFTIPSPFILMPQIVT